MPPTVPVGEPNQLVAGDTWTWTRAFDDFPPTDSPPWTITYYPNGPTTLAGFAAIVDPGGAGWLVSQPPSYSASALPGTYQWVAKASRTNGGVFEQHDADAGVFTLIPNYGTAPAAKSYNQTMLEQIRAVLLSRMSADVQEYAIAGRRMVKIPVLELLGLESTFAYRVMKERRPGKTAVTTKVRFGVVGF